MHGDDQGLNRTALPVGCSSVRRGYRRWHISDQRTHDMATKTSIKDIDLNSIPGKRYMSVTREWREEFIYFLLVDRFHDDRSRTPVKQAGHLRCVSVWCRSRIWSDEARRSVRPELARPQFRGRGRPLLLQAKRPNPEGFGPEKTANLRISWKPRNRRTDRECRRRSCRCCLRPRRR